MRAVDAGVSAASNKLLCRQAAGTRSSRIIPAFL
jgi:hypothetical protein